MEAGTLSDFKKLGKTTDYPFERPSASMLETFDNPGQEYSVSLETNEYTSLCPVTGQPDFAHVHITYTPHEKCVETKSLKLYLFAYRNEKVFMEAACNRIRDDLVEVLQPDTLVVTMSFTPRGGIHGKVISVHRRDKGWEVH